MKITKESNQSTIFFYNNFVKKVFKKNIINQFSSMKHEINMIQKFSCKYSPEIIAIDEDSYYIKKYDVVFGTPKKININNIKRILFTISPTDLLKQLDEIVEILNSLKIHHRDINPGNLIFSEKEKVVKLIDFYWANTDVITIKDPPGGINGIYGNNDKEAINKIKQEVLNIFNSIKKAIKNSKSLTKNFGTIYYPGSSKHKGKSYSPIDISYFNNILFHRNNVDEFHDIINNISLKNFTSVLDIGCATGYTTFNLLRNFSNIKIIGYEADPTVFHFLNNIKNIFCLDNLNFNSSINIKTKFPICDIVICMNVHMWLHKEFGQKCDKIIKNLILCSKEMFFQTAGSESHGMYVIKELNSKESIQEYLMSLLPKNSNKQISFIRSTSNHGGFRHLFKILES